MSVSSHSCPMANQPSLFICFAMKDFWHLHLINILDIVFPILVLYLDNRVDLRIFVNSFFPFRLMDASLTFLHFHFCCVDSRSFCMSSRRTWVLSSSSKLQEKYKHNNNYGEKIAMHILQIMKLPLNSSYCDI